MIALAAFVMLLSAAMADPLDRYRWSARPLVVFTPAWDDARFGALNAGLDEDGFAERDMLRVVVSPRSEPPDEAITHARLRANAGGTGEGPGSGTALRARFGVAPDAFAIILVGLDGGEKARWTAPPAPGEIFAVIDAMPMRLREMREGMREEMRGEMRERGE